MAINRILTHARYADNEHLIAFELSDWLDFQLATRKLLTIATAAFTFAKILTR